MILCTLEQGVAVEICCMSTNFDKVLFPTDFSELSLSALCHARTFVEVFDAELYCLHVVDEAFQYWGAMGPESIPPGPQADELLESAASRMDQFQADHLSNLKGTPVTHVALGRPFAEIIRYAREQRISLIVMGTHGRGAIAHILLGSTTEKVVRKAPCAVLTVRAPDQNFVMP